MCDSIPIDELGEHFQGAFDCRFIESGVIV